MSTPPITREAIKRLIRENGPMTVEEIAHELGKPKKTVGSCMSLARSGKLKHFYIKDHKPQIGRSGMPAALYAIGNRPDASRPTVDRKAVDRRTYEKHKALIKLRRSTRPESPFKSLITQVTR